MVLQQDEAKRLFYLISHEHVITFTAGISDQPHPHTRRREPSVTKDGATGTKKESKFHKDSLTDSLSFASHSVFFLFFGATVFRCTAWSLWGGKKMNYWK